MGLFNFADKKIERPQLVERARADRIYQDFMIGYVKHINEATLNVTIGGVRIGSAKRSRLAQINLKSRIITFSRYAVENVPEAGRRYLVIHELAHVKEPSHNKNFWQIVARYVPDYKQVEKELERCFKLNVRKDATHVDPQVALNLNPFSPGPIAVAKPVIARPTTNNALLLEQLLQQSFAGADAGVEKFSAEEDWRRYPFFDEDDDNDTGIVCGGSDGDDGEAEVYENFIS